MRVCVSCDSNKTTNISLKNTKGTVFLLIIYMNVGFQVINSRVATVRLLSRSINVQNPVTVNVISMRFT
jgi:hypothetical protein